MAEQFEVTQQELEYRPEQATDFVREFDNYIAERDEMSKPYEASLANRAKQEITDANKKVKEMAQLAELSNSLMEKLVKIQEKKNKEEYSQGLADALMEDPDLFGQQELEQEEAALVAGQKVATDTSEKYLAEGGTQNNARQIRNTGGWYGYGRFVGQLQLLGEGYAPALEQAKGSFTINIDGRELSYEDLSTPDEFNTWNRAFNQEYLKGVPRTNGSVVEKYVLGQVRRQANAERASWMRQYNEDQLKIEKEERQERFISDVSRGSADIAARYFAASPGSMRDKRIEMEENLIAGISTGRISREEAYNFYETQTIVKNGKRVTLAEAFPQQYGEFMDKADKQQTVEDSEYYAELDREAVQLDKELRSGPPLTNAQVTALMTSDKFRNNPRAQQYLQNHLTREEAEDEGSEQYLEDLYRNNQLTPEVLERFPRHIQDKFANKLQESTAIASEYDSEIGDQDAHGATRAALNAEIGEVLSQNDTEYRRIFRNAQAIHKAAYAEARRAGQNHTDAMRYANEVLTKQVEYKTNGSGASRLDYKPEPITLGGKVKKTLEYVKTNDNSFNVKLPNINTELQQAVDYLRTGRGSMPGFFSALAAGRDFSAEDLVLRQADLYGIDVEDIKQRATPYKQEKVKLRPELQRLLTVAPNSQTFAQATTRAVISGDDTKFFLDQVASKESAAHGEYDAYNLGGSANGTRAYGSGNSAEDSRFGKPITQMTIGEIKQLHATGQVHAVGRYQFVGTSGTFNEVAGLTKLPDDTVFSPEVQDLFAVTRLIQRASWGNLRTGLKSEWVGLQGMGAKTYERVLESARRIVEANKNPKQGAPSTAKKLAYTSGNIGPTSTGPHLDVKRVDGGRFEDGALDDYVVVKDPEFGEVTLGEIRKKTGGIGDSWDQHKARGSHGIDYGLHSGTEVYVTNGARVVSTSPSKHGDYVVIQLPNGDQYSFLHGKGAK